MIYAGIIHIKLDTNYFISVSVDVAPTLIYLILNTNRLTLN